MARNIAYILALLVGLNIIYSCGGVLFFNDWREVFTWETQLHYLVFSCLWLLIFLPLVVEFKTTTADKKRRYK